MNLAQFGNGGNALFTRKRGAGTILNDDRRSAFLPARGRPWPPAGLSALRHVPQGRRVSFAMEAPKECDFYEPAPVGPTAARIAIGPVRFGVIARGAWFHVTEGVFGAVVRDERGDPVVYPLVEPASH